MTGKCHRKVHFASQGKSGVSPLSLIWAISKPMTNPANVASAIVIFTACDASRNGRNIRFVARLIEPGLPDRYRPDRSARETGAPCPWLLSPQTLRGKAQELWLSWHTPGIPPCCCGPRLLGRIAPGNPLIIRQAPQGPGDTSAIAYSRGLLRLRVTPQEGSNLAYLIG